MSYRFFHSALVIAGLTLFSGSCFADELLSFYVIYFRPPSAGATRIPRSSGAGALVTLSNDPAGNIQGVFNVPLFSSPNKTINSAPYTLVSATILGGAEGVTEVFPDANGVLPPRVTVQVGSSPIDVEYTYMPSSGVGPPCNTSPCPSSVWIDEASEATGALLSDLFVEVFRPAGTLDAILTQTGNFLGIVDTTGAGATVTADVNPETPATQKSTGAIFDRWVSGQGLVAQGVRDLGLTSGQSGYFLAYYRDACPDNYHFQASPTLDSCVADNCKANQFWNPTTNQCESGCPPGETCGKFTCPKVCGNGCIVVPAGVPPNNKPGDTKPIFACKNDKGGIGDVPAP